MVKSSGGCIIEPPWGQRRWLGSAWKCRHFARHPLRWLCLRASGSFSKVHPGSGIAGTHSRHWCHAPGYLQTAHTHWPCSYSAPRFRDFATLMEVKTFLSLLFNCIFRNWAWAWASLQALLLFHLTLVIANFGEGNGTPLQYSCLENPMDRGPWWAAVHGVTRSQTRLSFWLHLCEVLIIFPLAVFFFFFPPIDLLDFYIQNSNLVVWYRYMVCICVHVT